MSVGNHAINAISRRFGTSYVIGSTAQVMCKDYFFKLIYISLIIFAPYRHCNGQQC